MTTLTPTAGGWRITCEEHGLDRTVETAVHAQNLFALHCREDHSVTPEDRPLRPADAARFLLLVRDSSLLAESTQIAVLGLWEALTGLYGDEALAYAQELATRPGTPTAHIAPF